VETWQVREQQQRERRSIRVDCTFDADDVVVPRSIRLTRFVVNADMDERKEYANIDG
jgi:hypothetical protein